MTHPLDQVAAALQESERRFRLLAEYSSDWLFMIDADQRCGYSSPACKEISGYVAEDFSADPALMSALIHPEDQPAFNTHLVHFASAGEHQAVVRILRRDGSIRWVEHRCQPMFDDAGKFIGRCGSNRDITTRIEGDAQRRVLSASIEQNPNSIIITDLERRITYVNAAFCQTTGYAAHEVIGQPAGMLRSPATPEETFFTLNECLATGRHWKGEFHNRRSDGSIGIDLAHIAPVRDEQGRLTHFIGLQEDITEKKHNGQELDRHRNHLEDLVKTRTHELQTAQAHAEAANVAKSEFLANMSHEIRTPMNAVIALSMLMLKDATDAKQRDRLTKVTGAAQHLLALINDILDFSKIEAGKTRLESIDFDLDKVISMVASQVEDSLREKGLQWVVESDPKISGDLHGDPLRLMQVLLNYAGNAVKFTSTGKITLRMRCLDRSKKGQLIRFEVSDTGSGFDPAQRESLFEAFEQADGSTTRTHGGTGLGLAISKRIATLMGGRVGAESTPGEGSTFWLEARFRNAVAPQEILTAQQRLKGRRAMLFGGSAAETNGLHILLGQLGVFVQTTTNIREATTRVEVAVRSGRPYDYLICLNAPKDVKALFSPDIRERLKSSDLGKVPYRILATQLGETTTSAMRDVAKNFDAMLPLPSSKDFLDEFLQSLPHGGAAAVALSITTPKPTQSQRVDLSDRTHLRILLVEDNLINQAVAMDILNSAGLSADIANNGQEAVAMAESHDYDLILMDVQMPLMDGLDATRAIRRLPDYHDTPILAMTANAFEADRQRTHAAGMNEHLSKPVLPEVLYAALQRWLPDRPVADLSGLRAAASAVPPAPTIAIAAEVELPNYPGLDTAAGLVALGGKRARYRQLLDRLTELHDEDTDKIRTTLAAGQTDEARRLAHSLKGAAALLGAETIRATALRIEIGIKSEAEYVDLDSDLAALDMALIELTSALRHTP